MFNQLRIWELSPHLRSEVNYRSMGMGSIIVIAAGIFSLVCGAASYALGYGVLVSLLVYVLSGHLLCFVLMALQKPEREKNGWRVRDAIEDDISALREREALANSQNRDLNGQSVFGLFRQRDRRP